MSLTLDVNSLFKTVISSGGAANEQNVVQQTPLQLETAAEEEDFHRSTTSIFEEIESLLKYNKSSLPNNTEALETSQTIVPLNIATTSNLDFNLPSCNTHDFLIPEDTHSFLNEDQLLFSVEHGTLQPISSPFLVPGIYKKIATASTANRNLLPPPKVKARNVFVTQNESQGRIVITSTFQDLYKCDLECSDIPEEFLKAHLRHVSLEKATEINELPKEDNAVLECEKKDNNPQQLDALSKLAYSLVKLSQEDHIVIDRNRNEIVRTESGTNQKTIYRFLAPETMGLKPHDEQHNVPDSERVATIKPKIGRPKKRPADDINQIIAQPTQKPKIAPQNRQPITKSDIAKVEQKAPQSLTTRTRSGRLVKLVKPLPIVTKKIEEEAADDPPAASAQLMRNFLAELKDNDVCYHNITNSTTLPTSSITISPLREEQQSVPLATSSPTNKRRVPPESICPTCKKIFLGRRLQRHFAQNPDHIKSTVESSTTQPPPTAFNGLTTFTSSCANDDMSLFKFLISKLQKSNLSEDQRADLFLHEINDLVEQLQLRSSRLIRNTSGLHFVTARSARVLGIPEGQYALDMSAIDSTWEPEPPCMINFATLPAPSVVNTRSLDYTTLSMSLDNTLTDEAAQKLNLSAGGKLLPPSEESLLRVVDDLVHEGMKKLVDESSLLHPPVSSTAVPHYDHASDNAVEAVSMKETGVVQQATPMLDLSVDFFQFNNN